MKNHKNFFLDFANIFDKIREASLKKDKQQFITLKEKDLYDLCKSYKKDIPVRLSAFFRAINRYTIYHTLDIKNTIPFKYLLDISFIRGEMDSKLRKNHRLISAQEFLILYLRNPFLISNISIEQAVKNFIFLEKIIMPRIVKYVFAVSLYENLEKKRKIEWLALPYYNNLKINYEAKEITNATIIETNSRASVILLDKIYIEIFGYTLLRRKE